MALSEQPRMVSRTRALPQRCSAAPPPPESSPRHQDRHTTFPAPCAPIHAGPHLAQAFSPPPIARLGQQRLLHRRLSAIVAQEIAPRSRARIEQHRQPDQGRPEAPPRPAGASSGSHHQRTAAPSPPALDIEPACPVSDRSQGPAVEAPGSSSAPGGQSSTSATARSLLTRRYQRPPGPGRRGHGGGPQGGERISRSKPGRSLLIWSAPFGLANSRQRRPVPEAVVRSEPPGAIPTASSRLSGNQPCESRADPHSQARLVGPRNQPSARLRAWPQDRSPRVEGDGIAEGASAGFLSDRMHRRGRAAPGIDLLFLGAAVRKPVCVP